MRLKEELLEARARGKIHQDRAEGADAAIKDLREQVTRSVADRERMARETGEAILGRENLANKLARIERLPEEYAKRNAEDQLASRARLLFRTYNMSSKYVIVSLTLSLCSPSTNLTTTTSTTGTRCCGASSTSGASSCRGSARPPSSAWTWFIINGRGNAWADFLPVCTLLFSLNCLPSTTVCSQLLFALNYCLPAGQLTPPLKKPSTS